MIEFEREAQKLVDLGLWVETDYQVSHRFDNVRFISYTKPRPGTKFWLGGKHWRIIGIRTLKEGQYRKERYVDKDGWGRHVDIPLSQYKPYTSDNFVTSLKELVEGIGSR